MNPSNPDPGPFVRLLGLLSGLGAVALGVGLVRRAEGLFGVTWASLMLVLGAIVLASLWALTPEPSRPAPAACVGTWEGEPARFLPRRSDRAGIIAMMVLILVLLGSWFVVMGVVGAIEENWLWPVLAALPSVYFLGVPVLALLGRFSAGGVWLTPTRVVNEWHGLRGELALADIAGVTPWSRRVRVVPVAVGLVSHTSLTPGRGGRGRARSTW